MEESIFKKVSESEKNNIFKLSVSAHVDFMIKGEGEQLYYLRVEEFDNGAMFICSRYNNSPSPNDEKGVLVSFIIEDERYYFQSELRNMPSGFQIAAPSDLFILHRRKQVRVKIPPAYKSVYNIIRHNEKVTFVDAAILDYSSGGLKLIYNEKKPKFQVGDNIRGVVRLGTRNPFEIDALIKYVAPDAAEQIFGIQFINITKLLETKLMTLTMDLHREILIKTNKK